MGNSLKISDCFNTDIRKLINDISDKVYKEINKLSRSKIKNFPEQIECLSDKEIKHYSKCCNAGHGLYVKPNLIKINPYMNKNGILMNFIHENLHHALPYLTEKPIDILTEYIGCRLNIVDDHILCNKLFSLR